ncbi:MAG: lipid-binding SYLF domain-containing protein [Halioglobus sp.]|jgi:lipid-binding SYLF domain-containing protein
MRGGVSKTLAIVLAGFFALSVLSPVHADDKTQIEAHTKRALKWMRGTNKHTAKILKNSAGVLVFGDMVKMGFGLGGEFGEGALVVDGKIVGYYAIAGKTFGHDIKEGYKAEVIVFKTPKTLKAFRDSRSWKIGENGVVPVMTSATNPGIVIGPAEPIVGLIFSEKNLITDLELKGNKITRISR